MLWINDLHKYYKTKNGEDHHALKGINLSLEEKGFICLLGKSGSGKSTLLNILGGLDTYDQGSIIIKNRHTEKFKTHDWDSFRNTYVGFIFQEFYMVDSFTIGKNIAISLELQGYPKKEIKVRVNEILKQVGLEGYANRKTSEISGGQKQRIAIARALIKDPQIILADEPTGNLDSETGKAILEILKQLSKEKLVIMVTHDAESARTYGDRIIELKDGIIISDGLTHEQTQDNIYENIEEDILSLIHFPKGKHLNQQLIQYLNQQTEQDEDTYIVLTTEPNLVTNSELDLNYSNKNNSLERDITNLSHVETLILKDSNLPTKNALKLALSNIMMKKFRFIFINFLFIISLILLGFATIFSFFDFEAASSETFKMNEVEYMGFRLESDTIQFGEKKIELYKSMNQVEINDLKEEYPEIEFTMSTARNTFFTGNSRQEMPYFTHQMNHVTIINDNQMFPLYYGRYPKNVGEILISDYIARVMRVFAYGQINMDELIGRTLESSNQKYTIVGIVDTDYEKFNHLVNSRIPERFEEENFFETTNVHYKHLYMNQDTYDISFNLIVTQAKMDNTDFNLKLVPTNDTFSSLLIGQSRLPVEKNEIVIPASEAYSLFLSKNIIDYDSNDPDLLGLIGENFNLKIKLLDQSSEEDDILRNYTIVGIYEDIESGYVTSNIGWFGTTEEITIINDLIYPYKSNLTKTYNWTYVKLSDDPDINEQFVLGMMDKGYIHVTEYSSDLFEMKDLFNEYESVLYMVSVIVATFTGLLIFLFISASISKKQKEIGILRAIGARGIDISKIYMFESFIIAIVSSLWANGIIIGLVYFGNYYLQMEMNFKLVLLTIGVYNVLIVFGFALIVTMLSSFLPIKRITVMKPIKAIKRI